MSAYMVKQMNKKLLRQGRSFVTGQVDSLIANLNVKVLPSTHPGGSDTRVSKLPIWRRDCAILLDR